MTNFIFDRTTLYADTSNKKAVPASENANKFWDYVKAQLVKTALLDIQSVLQAGAGAPAGAGLKSALYFDLTNAKLYQNQDGGTTWAAIGSGVSPYCGDGSDGDAVFDGVATVLGMVPAAGVYTNNKGRDLFLNNATINVGVTVKPAGYPLRVKATLHNDGLIHNNGGDADGTGLGGAASLAGFLGAGGAGGNGGNAGAPAAGGGNSAHVPREFATGHTTGGTNAVGQNGGVGQGGGGGGVAGAGDGGTGGATTSLQSTRDADVALQGHGLGDANALTGGTGGGGGRGDGFVGIGGGGGGGGGWCVVCAHAITGSGAIQARGGRGANGISADGGGGGGGGGGVLVVMTDGSSVPNTFDANGGAGGTHAGAGHDGGSGGAGLAIAFKGG